MVRSRRARLQVEALEVKALLSMSPLSLMKHVAVSALVDQTKPVHPSLLGVLPGAVQPISVFPPSPDAGKRYDVSGQGLVASLGLVQFTGTLQTTGSINSSQAMGTLTLTNARGSVTLSLVGPQQQSFSPLPDQFQFTIADATWAFTSLKGDSGTVLAEWQPTAENPSYVVFVINSHSSSVA